METQKEQLPEKTVSINFDFKCYIMINFIFFSNDNESKSLLYISIFQTYLTLHIYYN